MSGTVGFRGRRWCQHMVGTFHLWAALSSASPVCRESMTGMKASWLAELAGRPSSAAAIHIKLSQKVSEECFPNENPETRR